MGWKRMDTKSVTDARFESEVLNSSQLTLVDFWAEWCGPCQALSPKLDEIAQELGDSLQVVKINIDENPETPRQFGVRGIPTLAVFKEGKRVDQITGNCPKEDILNMVRKYL